MAVAWIIPWTFGGAVGILGFLYKIKGKECLRIDPKAINYIRDYVVFKQAKVFDIASVSNVRVYSNEEASSRIKRSAIKEIFEFWGLTGGSIAFDYGSSTQRFGVDIDEAEAKHLIETLQLKMKRG